ncbi:MAG: 30S ribosome-binding factor RbfA [Gemmatimonadales bacterium]|nr:30S ribosome-binding factor RbfA [Gemmatimonadales bacterium]
MRRATRGPSRRPEQVAETIRQIVADALLRDDVRDPRVASGVTVTAVHVSGDLSHARVLVSIPGDDEQRERTIEGLGSAASFLRSRAAKVLTTRIVPMLHFERDTSPERAARIDELLSQIREETQD